MAVAWKVVVVNLCGELSPLSGGGVACPMGVDRLQPQIAPSESFTQPYQCWQRQHLDYLVGGVVVVIYGSPWSSSGAYHLRPPSWSIGSRFEWWHIIRGLHRGRLEACLNGGAHGVHVGYCTSSSLGCSFASVEY
jgi:hypothetical protein